MRYLILITLIIHSWNVRSQELIDKRDNKVYSIVTEGSQTWMAENLAYNIEGAISYNNADSNAIKLGFLYTWETSQNICPEGWKLPNENDWDILIDHLGGKNAAGGKLKLNGISFWKSPNRFGSNSINFSALPGGALIDGVFTGIGESAYFWSSEAECTSGYVKYLTFKAGFADTKVLTKTDNASVRCLKK